MLFLQEHSGDNHLFLQCPLAYDLWNMSLLYFKISWVMPQSFREAYMFWSSWIVDKTIRKAWNMIPAEISWCIWTERNKRCYDGSSSPLHALKAKCLVNPVCWTKLSPVSNTGKLLDFISTLNLEGTNI
ncbi:hypothetical protein MTR67_019982 [Solanum verrucosum]|uniref:Reverse transcriptase zinc-binding domain-containing protein n=1 Tax=Solanum verrucosum TaxID=315347 RepID=A0AAF0QPR0_SOLVR|nr:hypothetical protein MTR67_019982 [Solanum verrucosum]